MQTLDAAAASVADEVAELLRDSPLRPYDTYAATFQPEQYLGFCQRTVRSILASPHARSSMIRIDDSCTGAACWSFLPFDSEHLEVECARVDWLLATGSYSEARKHKTELLARVREQCRIECIRYLTARVHATDYSTIHALEEAGFELVDGIQKFAKRLCGDVGKLETGFTARLYQAGDLPDILSIARTSYVFDRFHSDSFLPNQAANRVNERWVENSCLGIAADAVVVALNGDRPVGYVTCKVDRTAEKYLGTLFGNIGMVATDLGWRGRGIARLATQAALDWFANQGVGVVEVGTQLGNIPASRLYETCGFKLLGNSLTFRKLLS
jgi:dTDP-4-amino-4,6-dideoxy-D-galactose acyltransferase